MTTFRNATQLDLPKAYTSVLFTRFVSEFRGGTTDIFNDSGSHNYEWNKLEHVENYPRSTKGQSRLAS